MRFRRRFSSGKRKRPIWVNIPFANVAFTESAGNQALMVPEDWEAQFSGIANETATLRAIVGEVTLQTTTVGTSGNTGYWGIYISDTNATVVPSFSTSGMADVDWLHVGAFGVPATLVTATAAQPSNSRTVNIKAKRRLKSRDQLFIVAQFGNEAAAPVGTIGGILRFLVARD